MMVLKSCELRDAFCAGRRTVSFSLACLLAMCCVFLSCAVISPKTQDISWPARICQCVLTFYTLEAHVLEASVVCRFLSSKMRLPCGVESKLGLPLAVIPAVVSFHASGIHGNMIRASGRLI